MVFDLENLDNTLKLFDPTYEVEAICSFRTGNHVGATAGWNFGGKTGR
jgi:hypothetical protein